MLRKQENIVVNLHKSVKYLEQMELSTKNMQNTNLRTTILCYEKQLIHGESQACCNDGYIHTA